MAQTIIPYVYDEQDMITAYSVAEMAKCYSGKVGCLVRPRASLGASMITACNEPLSGNQNCYEAGGCLTRSDGKKDRCVRTVHAEMRVVSKAVSRGVPLVGATLIQTKMCCLYCAKLLAELGVDAVYYVEPNSTLPAVGVEMFLPMRIIRVERPETKTR